MNLRHELKPRLTKPRLDMLIGFSWGSGAILFALLLLLAPVSLNGANAQESGGSKLTQEIDRLRSSRMGNALVGISVVDLDSGQQIVDLGATRPLKPASVLKLVTSAVVLSELGPNYRYKTALWSEPVSNGLVGTVAIRGVGAPDLVIESVWLLARRLRSMGIKQIARLVIDQSAFPASRQAVGQRAYQTGAAALSFNYNSIAVVVCPTKIGQDATIRLDPWEIASKIRGKIDTVSRGDSSFSIDQDSTAADGALQFVARGGIAASSECKTVYRSVDDPGSYLLSTARQLFEGVGIRVGGVGEIATIPSHYKLLTTIDSKYLSEIVTDLNHFSTNFIAEQLLHTLGEQPNGVFSRSAGLARMATWLKSQGITEDQFEIADASGLSHDSRATAQLFTTLLKLMFRNQRVGPEFVSSLSIGEESGTLRKRQFGAAGAKIFIRAKTGTLNGVSSLAGYIQTAKGRNMAFAILLNQVSSKERALEFEDDVVGLIYQH